MDFVQSYPSLPAYGKVDSQTNQCIINAANKYNVPELLVHSIILVENGNKGQCVVNRDSKTKQVKSYDCGLAQINTVHLEELSKYGITISHIAHDNCLNVATSAYILRKYYNEKQDWTKTIIAYNIGPANWTPQRLSVGVGYANKVINYWKQLYNYTQKQQQYAKNQN